MHRAYARYLLRHKWFVLCAGLRTAAPLWRLLVHDWSKVLPDEWNPYAAWFYGREQGKDEAAFNRAWLRHLHRNKHHWQHWVLAFDDGSVGALPMPERFVREMVADWAGAGRAITGRWEVHTWYVANRHKMMLHADTVATVERVLPELARRERHPWQGPPALH